MTMHVDVRRSASEAEPFGLLAEGAAAIAVIVLAIVALAGVSTQILAAIVAIIIGGGLMVQAFNTAAEYAKSTTAETRIEFGGAVMVDCLCGLTGIVLGILAVVGFGTSHLLPAALIVYGGGLLVGGADSVRSPGAFAPGGMEMLVGLAAIVLGILSTLMVGSSVLVLVGFLAVGAAMLLVSASLSDVVLQLFRSA
jgi:hypothetical protein